MQSGIKNKHSKSFKLKVVKAIKAGMGLREASRRFGLHSASIHLWVKRYHYHGAKAFSDIAHARKPYSAQFKWQVLSTMEKQQLSARETVALFNLSSINCIREWRKRYALYGKNGLEPHYLRKSMLKKPKKPESTAKPTNQQDWGQQLKAQKKEIEYLRAENAYLKKLRALREKSASLKK